MKKIIYSLILSCIALSGFANGEINKGDKEKLTTKSSKVTELNSARKIWEATPDGIFFKKWEASPAGRKVDAASSKISKSVINFSNMQAVVTSLTLPAGARLGFGVMVKIQGEDYILSFGAGQNNEFKQLRTLQVNDKIIIRSHFISKAPKYAYPIVAGDYVERNGVILFKRILNKGGC